jgi:hypothetical protein
MADELGVTPESPPVETVAESSPAVEAPSSEQAVKPSSMLEAVQEALKPTERAEAKESAPQPEAEAGQEQKPPVKTDEVSTDEKDYAKEPFGKHPRFKRVLTELKTVKERSTALASENAKLKEDFESSSKTVTEFETFRGAVQEAGLSASEVSEGFTIMALMKQEPEKALPMLLAKVEMIQQFLGEKLPSDLQERVDKGLVDEETARLLSRERAKYVNDSASANARAESVEARQAQSQTATLKSAVDVWESQWKSSDPDYAKKSPFVESEVLRLIKLEGPPQTAKAATDLAEKAKKNVEERLSSFRPAKPEVRRVSGGDGSSTIVAKPKSLLEAVTLAANAQI